MPEKPLEVPGLPRKRVKALVRYWEERFPQKGQALTELLGPFYVPTLFAELRPPATNLAKRASDTVFWQSITGVRVERMDVDSGSGNGDSVEEGILAASLANSLSSSLRDSVEDALWEKVWGSFWDSGMPPQPRFGLDELVGREIAAILAEGLAVSLIFAVCFYLTGNPRKEMSSLLTLWRSGNLPLGLDKTEKLIVICA